MRTTRSRQDQVTYFTDDRFRMPAAAAAQAASQSQLVKLYLAPQEEIGATQPSGILPCTRSEALVSGPGGDHARAAREVEDAARVDHGPRVADGLEDKLLARPVVDDKVMLHVDCHLVPRPERLAQPLL